MHGEFGRIMVNADIDKPLIFGDIIHTVRNRLAEIFIGKVVHVDLSRILFLTPRLAFGRVISNVFLLFRVDRNHRLTTCDQPFRSTIDLFELSVPVGMVFAFFRFAIALQGIFVFFKSLATVLAPVRKFCFRSI